MTFLIDWQWIWFKNYFKDNKFRKSSSILMKIHKMLFLCWPKKEKTYKRIAVIYFLLSIQLNILTLYNNCHVILTTYMLDSALEPLYM